MKRNKLEMGRNGGRRNEKRGQASFLTNLTKLNFVKQTPSSILPLFEGRKASLKKNPLSTGGGGRRGRKPYYETELRKISQ